MVGCSGVEGGSPIDGATSMINKSAHTNTLPADAEGSGHTDGDWRAGLRCDDDLCGLGGEE